MSQTKRSFISSKLPNIHNSKNRPLRISDILAIEDEEEDFDRVEEFKMDDFDERRKNGTTRTQCLSPRRIIARWIDSFRRVKERRVDKECKREKEVRGFDGGLTHTRGSTNGLIGDQSSTSVLDSRGSGCSWKDASFNLGVGCSLFYLIAASKNELAKTVELRKQMEMLLQDVKHELQRKNNALNPFQSNAELSCSSAGIPECSNCTSQVLVNLNSSSQVVSDLRTIIPVYSLKSDSHEEEESFQRIDELEAEFEAELELLQLHLDSEDSGMHPQQQRIETSKDTYSSRSFRTSSEELIDPQEESSEMQQGISPTELQRRLHELVEKMQEERIKKLEIALESAKQEIREKESELSWWKENAKTIFQHVSAPSQLGLDCQHDQIFR